MEQPKLTDEQPRYTRQEVLALAQKLGTPLEDRMLTKLIELGLLPAPHHPGLGKGKGSIAWWSEEELRMMCIMLPAIKTDTPRELLYNVPVYYWLHDGPTSGVSLVQVQKAIRHWVRRRWGMFTAHKGREVAAEAVKELAHPSATGTRALQAALTAWGDGQEVDMDELTSLLDRVVAPQRRRSTLEAERPSRIAHHLEGLMSTWKLAVKEGLMLPDALWEWARMRVLLSQFASQEDEIAVDRAVAKGRITFLHPYGEWFFTACAEVAFSLGVAYQITQKGEGLQGFPPELHPAYWERGTPRASVESRRVESRLVLPRGYLPMYHEITVTFSSGPEAAED